MEFSDYRDSDAGNKIDKLSNEKLTSRRLQIETSIKEMDSVFLRSEFQHWWNSMKIGLLGIPSMLTSQKNMLQHKNSMKICRFGLGESKKKQNENWRKIQLFTFKMNNEKFIPKNWRKNQLFTLIIIFFQQN